MGAPGLSVAAAAASDAYDEMALGTAVNGRAEILATFNVGDFAAMARALRRPRPAARQPASVGGDLEMRRSDVPLRLSPSLLDETCKVATDQGSPSNQVVNVALAEKLSALRIEGILDTPRDARRSPAHPGGAGTVGQRLLEMRLQDLVGGDACGRELNA